MDGGGGQSGRDRIPINPSKEAAAAGQRLLPRERGLGLRNLIPLWRSGVRQTQFAGAACRSPDPLGGGEFLSPGRLNLPPPYFQEVQGGKAPPECVQNAVEPVRVSACSWR